MFIIFFLLFLASLIMIPVALINPKFATKGKYQSRKKAFYAYGIAMLAFFVLAVATTPPQSNTTQVAGETIQATPVPEVNNEEQKTIPSAPPITDPKALAPVITATPSPTIKPTATPKPTSTPTAKPTIKPTSTPKSVPTKAPESAPPTQNMNLSGDKDCGDFSSQSAAQSYFNAKGGSASNNVDDLDRDHDGIACESLK